MHGIQTAWVHFCMLPHAIHASTQYAFPFDRKTIHNILSAQNHLATDYMAHYCLNFVFEYVFISRLVVCRCSQKCVNSIVFEQFNAFCFACFFNTCFCFSACLFSRMFFSARFVSAHTLFVAQVLFLRMFFVAHALFVAHVLFCACSL